ncbi:MAG: hybrid sensor histidine kinase/response regulator, partial [Pseudanabaena sp. ELA748]
TEHIQKIEDGILYLEKHPQDIAKLEELLREAHSLKGDSRMLGVGDAETLIHQIEEVFASIKKGETNLTPDLCDRIYKGVDAIAKIANEAVTGEPANVKVFHTLAQLMGADADMEIAPSADSIKPDQAIPDLDTSDDELNNLFADFLKETSASELSPELSPNSSTQSDLVTQTESPSVLITNDEEHPTWGRRKTDIDRQSEPITAEDYQIDTIRVESSRLDRLLTQASELLVTQRRFSDRTSDIQSIQSLWEEWSRETFVSRTAFDQLERRLQDAELKPIQKFYHQVDQRLELLGNAIEQLKNATSDNTARLEVVSKDLESGIRTLRLLPMSTIFNLYPRSVRDISKQLGKEVNLIVEGGGTFADKQILEAMKAPLSHLIRNAIDHGIESPEERQRQGKPRIATIRLSAYQVASSICIEVEDDGHGIDIEQIKLTAMRRNLHSESELATMSTAKLESLIFAPGFSTRSNVNEISGRGVGLDVVRANVEKLKGNLQLDSTLGKGCKFRLTLNTSQSTTQVMIVQVAGTPYAIPLDAVQTMFLVSPQEMFMLKGSQTMTFEDESVSIVWLADLLGLSVQVPATSAAIANGTQSVPCLMMQNGTERLVVLVDALLEQQNIVIKPQCKLLKRVRNIAGATILGNGEVCIVLNPQDLFKSAKRGKVSISAENSAPQVAAKTKILLCDDSIPIRTQLKRILEGYGYDVTAAIDGQDGFDKLRMGIFDAVVSDVQMPNLDGLGLAQKIRQFPEYGELPIILITTLASDEDKRLGIKSGANAYITKGDFDQRVLLDTLRRLI